MENSLELTPVMVRFILHWGEMGTRWGVNRTVAQVFALLYIAPNPLNAEAIASTLSIARSTVSTNLRELQSWGVIKVIQVLGDRRDHYETYEDVWELFQIVLEERKRREVDPTLEMLRESVDQLSKKEEEEAYTRERLMEMLDFFETVTSFYDQLDGLPSSALRKLAGLESDVRNLLHKVRA